MDTTAEVLRAAALDLTRTLHLDAVLDKVLEHLAKLVPYDTANVLLLGDDSRLSVRAIRGYETWGTPHEVRRSVFDVTTHPIFGQLLTSGRSLLIPDTRDHSGWQRHPGAEHVRSWMGVPLLAGGRAIGLFSVDKGAPLFFSEEHLRRAEAMAPHAAIAIGNAHLFEGLAESERRFRALVENSSEALTLIGPDRAIRYASPSALAVLGLSVGGMRLEVALEHLHPDDRERARELARECLDSPGRAIPGELRFRPGHGSYRVLELVGVNRLNDPTVGAVVLNYRDITQRKEAQEQIEALNLDLQRQVAEFRTLIDVIPIGIAIARDPECRWVAANPSLTRQFGLPPGSNTSFSAPDEALRSIHYEQEGRTLAASELPMQLAVARGAEVRDMEMEIVREGRSIATILGYAAPLFDEKGRPRGAIGASLDITERKHAEQAVRSLAYHDALTGLPNRLLFTDRLALAVAQAHRLGHRLAVMFLDLDRFKLINDSLGHSAGDRLIQEIAARLRACVREGDTVARLGGDEFILLLPGVAQVVDAAKVADKVLESLRAPVTLDSREVYVTASMGISLYPDDGLDAETLLKNSDVAMYRAKEQGRDNYQLFTSAMNATALERLALESGLRRALPQGEIVLHYQPILDVAKGHVHGVEALLRWNHPELGLISPTEFVPLAEATGLILPMGPWALRTACAQLRIWQDQISPTLSVAVNLSARQFQQADLTAQVTAALDASGIQPRFLELEITESNAMQHAETTIRTLRELKSLGVSISIDDFGTGYSSLSYLKRFPIDTLKIDKSFIRDIPGDHDDVAITRAVIAMARTLKLCVVAEGVETEEQLTFLGAEGCDRIQGYLFAHPVPPERCADLLARHKPRT